MSGNPLAMTAGITTLKLISSEQDFYQKLTAKVQVLSSGIKAQAEKHGLTLQYHSLGSMMCIFFSEEPVYDYESAKKSDIGAFNTYFHAMLEQGIYLAPAQFEAGFMSVAHSEEDIDNTIDAARRVFAKL